MFGDEENIPFKQWYDDCDPESLSSLLELEKYLGRGSVVTNSVQSSIHMCLELMGSTTHLIPVAMPVNSPPDALAACLRAGGHPLLLDIQEDTLQMDPTLLAEALEELEEIIVYLYRPGGQPVDDAILDLVQDFPTIVDSRTLPCNILPDDLCGVFNLFDLAEIAGAGSVIFHKHPEQVKQLKFIRNGILGHSGHLSPLLCARVKEELSGDLSLKLVDKQKVLKEYEDALSSLIINTSKDCIHIRVPDAAKVVSHLSSFGVVSMLGIYPLSYVDEVRKRWEEQPEYPVAEALASTVVALPVHSGVLGKASFIAEKIAEV